MINQSIKLYRQVGHIDRTKNITLLLLYKCVKTKINYDDYLSDRRANTEKLRVKLTCKRVV